MKTRLMNTTCLLAAFSGLAIAQESVPGAPGGPPMPQPPHDLPGMPGGARIETIDATVLEEPIRWGFRSGSVEDEPVRSGPVTYLGISPSPAPRELSAQLPIDPDTGLVVDMVAKDSPAEKAGLQASDVLIKLDDQILIQPRQLSVLVANKKEGDSVKLTYLRKGQSHEASVVLGKREVERFSSNATTHGFSGPAGAARSQADIMLESRDGGPLRTFVRRFNIPGGSGAGGFAASGGSSGFGGPGTTGSGGAVAGEMSAGGPPPPAPNPPDGDVKKELAEIRAMLEALQQKMK